MDVTVLGTTYDSFVLPAGQQMSLVLSLLNKTPSTELYPLLVLSTVMEVREVQFSNALLSIDMTEGGMVTEVSPVQWENASTPMDVTKSGMVTEVSPLQPKNTPDSMDVIESGIVTEVSLVQL